VRRFAASDSWRSLAEPVSLLPYKVAWPRGADRRAQGFGKLDDCLARSGTRHTHDDLPGSDDLARLRQSLDDHAVRISKQDCVARLVARNVGAGVCGIELRSGRLGGRLHFVVGRCRDEVRGDEAAVSRLVVRSLARARPGGRNGLLVRAHGEPQIRGIDTDERLAALDGLPGIHQPSQDLPGDPESQVALHAGRDDSGERTL
jgi:hypothetical protein